MQNRQATTLSEELIGHRLSSKVDLRTAASPASYRSDRAADAPSAGLLVVNADDWGRDQCYHGPDSGMQPARRSLFRQRHGIHGGFGSGCSTRPRTRD